MVRLGELDNPRLAQAFVDYLNTRQIRARVRPSEQMFVIWLEDESASTLAGEELSRFLVDPQHPRYRAASWQRLDDPGVRFSYRGQQVLRSSFLAHGGWVTKLVLAVCIAVFAGWNLGWHRQLFEAMAYLPLLAEPWRLLTPAFLHFSALHIVFNLLWWWFLGGQIETIRGSGRLLTILLVSAILSNTAQFLVSGNNFGGLSGVVYALGGYVWLTGRQRPGGRITLPDAYFGFMLVWLVIGYIGMFGPQMANTAHTSGLLCGLVMAWLDRNKVV